MEDKSFKNRVGVQVIDDSGEFPIFHVIPIDAFSPGIATPHAVVDGCSGGNFGYTKGIPRFTFSLTVKQMGDVVAKLLRLQMKGLEFKLIAQEQAIASSGRPIGDWAFKIVMFERCVIVNSGPGGAIIGGLSTATFTCLSLRATYSDYVKPTEPISLQ